MDTMNNHDTTDDDDVTLHLLSISLRAVCEREAAELDRANSYHEELLEQPAFRRRPATVLAALRHARGAHRALVERRDAEMRWISRVVGRA